MDELAAIFCEGIPFTFSLLFPFTAKMSCDMEAFRLGYLAFFAWSRSCSTAFLERRKELMEMLCCFAYSIQFSRVQLGG